LKLTLAEHIAKSRIIVAANKAKGNRHAEMFATMYAQPARFIEEILQNTEDAYARKKAGDAGNSIRFKLFADRIEIHHNGQDFDEADLMSITTFANTTKNNDNNVNQIGKFGIGFKSVFSITDTPEIHCEPYHYIITDFEVLESTVPKNPDENFNTLIILPFKKKTQEACFDTVKKGLNDLNEYSLLFLKNIDCIENIFSGIKTLTLERRLTLTDKTHRRVNMCKTNIQTGKMATDYIIFSRLPFSEKQQPELAFKIEINQEKITFVPIANAPVFVYFPTRMNSRLHFIVNAPFTTNPLREYIPFDDLQTAENMRLLGDCKKLFSKVLNILKQKKWFDLRLIAMLPVTASENNVANSNGDSLIYRAFYDTLLNFFQSEASIPLPGNKYAGINEVLIPHNEELAELLKTNDLQVLFQKKYFIDPQINAIHFSEVKKYFEEVLQIKTADAQGFGFRLRVAIDFLKEKNVLWLKKLYQYLHKNQFLWDEFHMSEYYSLRSAAIILAQSGSFAPAFTPDATPGVFLPVDTKCLLPVIHKKLAGDAECFAFFQDMGIREPEMADDIEFNIIPQFDNTPMVFSKGYVKSLEKIVQAYISVSRQRKEKIADLLKKTPWLCCVTFGMPASYAFKKPEDIYLHSDGLMSYFEGNCEARVVVPAVFRHLNKKSDKAFSLLLEETGIRKFPGIMISEDKPVTMDGWDNFLKSLTIIRSRAFANMLLSNFSETIPTDIKDFLNNKKWIYTTKNLFESPESITQSDLSELYKFSDNDKGRLCYLLGIRHTRPDSLQQITEWYPSLTPEKAAIAAPHMDSPATPTGTLTMEQHAVLSMAFPNGKQDDSGIYSGESLKNILLWSCSYIKNILQKSVSNNNSVEENTDTSDLSVYSNEGNIMHIFVCGKTDLLNYFPLTAGQLTKILNLSLYAKDTYLYLVSSAGTERVSFNRLINPLNLLTKGDLSLKGNIWIIDNY